jgi:two-component system response regulator MprA
MPSHLLVVDDDPKITSFLRRALTAEGYTVTAVNDAREALDRAEQAMPDVVILDIMMPGLDGLEICRRLRATSDVPILLLTARDEVADRVRGLDAGADDYLVKPFALEELLARTRALLRRRGADSHAVLRFQDLTLRLDARQAQRGERRIDLTAKEFELLHLLMRNPRNVLVRDRILEKVWGYDFEGDPNVLDVYIGYLRHKLEAGGEPRLIHTVRGIGYVLREP